jgi:arylsulfatase A-like enzyme
VEPSGWRREVHWSYDFRDVESQKIEQALGLASDQCALSVVRGVRYKYIHFTGLRHLFFDLEEDPWEQKDLSSDPAYQGLVLEYAQMMLSWRMNHEDRVLRNTKLAAQGPVIQRGPRRPTAA